MPAFFPQKMPNDEGGWRLYTQLAKSLDGNNLTERSMPGGATRSQCPGAEPPQPRYGHGARLWTAGSLACTIWW